MSVQNALSIAMLRTISGATNPSVFVEGYTAAGDGGGGNFFYNLGDTTSADNGATIIVATDGSRFYRIWDKGAFNVLWAGADRTGSNSSDSAFASSASVSSVLYVPHGRYKLNNNFSYTIPAGNNAFTLLGDGMEQSILYFPSNGGITINYNTSGSSNSLAHVRDLSITAGEAGGGSGLQLVYNSSSNINSGFSDVTNVRLRGDDGISSYYWSYAILISGVSSINFDSLCITGPSSPSQSSGNGIYLSGNSIGSIVYNINSSIIDSIGNGVVYGDYIQGVTVSNTNFTNVVVSVTIPGGVTAIDQLSVVGCQFATTAANIQANSTLGNVTLSSNIFSYSGTPTANLVQGSFTNFMASNNVFIGSAEGSGSAIEISSTATGVITGNIFIYLGTAIVLGSGTTKYSVQSNVYNAVSTPVSNSSGSNTIGGGSE